MDDEPDRLHPWGVGSLIFFLALPFLVWGALTDLGLGDIRPLRYRQTQ